MKIYAYDFEVFKEDWLVVFQNADNESEDPIVIHNNNYKVKEFMSQKDLCVIGFNTKDYDQHILQAVLEGADNHTIKKLNDWIIQDKMSGWQFPYIQGTRRNFYNSDLRDDMYVGLSLKAIEGHLYQPIVESSIPFDIDRKLTPEELQEVIEYCKTDVKNTLKIYQVRQEYLQCKQHLGKMAKLLPKFALTLTNAKLTAKYLGAKKREWHDGRNYQYPETLDTSLIPKEILDFFDQIHNESIPDEELFKKKLVIDIGECATTYSWGGVHGSLKKAQRFSTAKRVIQNRDVSSLYPSLMDLYNYISRNCQDPNIYRRTKAERLKAKHAGDDVTAKTLKNPLNATSGAMDAPHNDLYDPLMARSMRISGQLFMTMLVYSLLEKCKTIEFLNINTDGIMYEVDVDELPLVDSICAEWEKKTRFELETDEIEKVFIKDVNNLIFKQKNGKIKKVGSYLAYGITEKGAWTINNSIRVVKRAIAEYLMNDVPVEDTILKENNIFEFQIIATAGATYRSAYHEFDGQKIPVQKVNRVYATNDLRYGTIKKEKEDRADKIASLPEHCLIDNENKLSIKDIDKSFYIERAYSMLTDYLGYEPERTKGRINMINTMNIFEKLMRARQEFLEREIKKSGVNEYAEFTFFELKDIVPTATEIFAKYNLIFVVTAITYSEATGILINVDNPDETIVFTTPMRDFEIEKQTKMNGIQASGAYVTYQRRYLYQLVLDLIENDSIDKEAGKTESKAKAEPKKSKKPATPKEREEIKKELVGADDEMTALQVKSLKAGLKKLRDKDAEKYRSFVNESALKIKAGMTKKEAEALQIEIGNMIEE